MFTYLNVFLVYQNEHSDEKIILRAGHVCNELTAYKPQACRGANVFFVSLFLYWNKVLFKPICELRKWQDSLDIDDVDDDINHNNNKSNNNNTIKI